MGKRVFSSFVSIEDHLGRRIEEVSTDIYSESNIPRFIDPKVICIKDSYYITFNSGWVPSGNDIFVMKVYPETGSPKRVIYKHRKEQERNWAFFSEDNEIYALYWINPLKLLKLRVVEEDSWNMEDYFCGDTLCDPVPQDMTMGTQMFRSKDRYYFVAHQKKYYGNKKIYLGRLLTFHWADRKIEAGKYWLSHSLDSIMGSDTKYNTNLYSCTYFSGLQIADQSIKLGYGVNDVDYGFSKHPIGDL